VEQFQPELWKVLERVYGGFGSGDLRQLTALLRRTLQRLDQLEA
jgi:hypothetical protein